MQNKRITKMYQNLSCREKATLSFGYILSNDTHGLSRIANTVSHHTYSCRDIEYSDWLAKSFTFASTWSLLYWQNYASYAATLALFAAALANENVNEDAEGLSGQINFWKGRLFALNGVLNHLCEKYGLSVDAVHKYGDVESFIQDGATNPDMEYQNQMTEMLDQIILSDTH